MACTSRPSAQPFLTGVLKNCSTISRKEDQDEKMGEVGRMSRWLSHTENIHSLQGTHDSGPSKRGRLPWNYCPKDHGLLLSKVMLFLSEKEEHPPPSSPSDPDYKQIYRYLSQVLAGEEPSQLTQGSAKKVMEMLKEVQEVAKKSKQIGKLNHNLRMNRPSHMAAGREKEPKQDSEEKDESQECLLFCEMDGTESLNVEDEEIKELHKDDPFYELKKVKALQKCKEKQSAVVSSLSNVRGINPFDLSHNLLVKPQGTMEDIFK